MRTPLLAASACAAALLAGCGGDDGAGSSSPTTTSTAAAAASATPTTTIAIKDFTFDPEAATITVGQKISVPNEDAAPHTLTDRPSSGKASFDTGTLKGGQTGSFTATKPGTYKVYCVLHPFMEGEVTVVS